MEMDAGSKLSPEGNRAPFLLAGLQNSCNEGRVDLRGGSCREKGKRGRQETGENEPEEEDREEEWHVDNRGR